ncbi:MAG: hypothetical protein OEY64_10470 [Nitrospinota bacterium]|nr:hypothetical protein [Nitrospinota bacterium]
MLTVELPDAQKAMQASLATSRDFGIGFTTSPAIPVYEFDTLIK